MVSTLIWTRATFNWSEANALTCTAPPYLTEVPRSLRGGTHDKAPNMLNTRLYNVLYRMIISKYWMRFLWYPEKLRSRQVLSAKPKAEADNTYRDLDYLGYHKNRMHKSNHCFYTLFWRKKKNTVARNLDWYCYWKSSIAHATYGLVSYLQSVRCLDFQN